WGFCESALVEWGVAVQGIDIARFCAKRIHFKAEGAYSGMGTPIRLLFYNNLHASARFFRQKCAKNQILHFM
ncbi:MAG: hypothetical protein K2L51_03745, partial [Clostridiales bacterium]|nr:hypothetical protein [Clostridiales bacterium]